MTVPISHLRASIRSPLYANTVGKWGGAALDRAISYSGDGYTGSTYTSTVAGQWTADGVAIAGETGTTYVLSVANEGKIIRCVNSNAIQMWTPLALASGRVVAWYDARVGITLNVTKISNWADRIAGAAMLNATDGNRPVYETANTIMNNKPAAVYTGANSQRLTNNTTLNRATPFTRIVCAAHGAGAFGTFGDLIDGQSSSNRGGFFIINGASGEINMYTGTGNASVGGILTAATPFIVTGMMKGGSNGGFARLNGVSGAVMTGMGTNTSRLGVIGGNGANTGFWNGPISQVLDCADLTQDEYERIEGYLSSIMGVALVGSHTYFAGVPPIIDSTPAAFTFTDITGATETTFYESNTITLAGLTAGQPTYVTSTVPYSQNGGSYTSGPTVAYLGDTFKLGFFSGSGSLTAVSGTLTVGGVSDTYTVTTANTLVTLANMFPYQIDRMFHQEDVSTGAVASWPASTGSRRTTAATQGTGANQPNKLAANAGVEFIAGSTIFMDFGAGDSEAYVDVRGGRIVASADMSGGSGIGYIYRNNGVSGGNGNPYRQPFIFFNSTTNVVQLSCLDGGTGVTLTSQVLTGTSLTDFHVIIWWRRGNYIFMQVDGGTVVSSEYKSWKRQPNSTERNRIGYDLAVMPITVRIDSIDQWDGELTDKQVDVLVGDAAWNRPMGSIASVLPGGHAYKSAAPNTSTYNLVSDQHSFFKFNQTAWNAFVADLGNVASSTYKYFNRGGVASPSTVGYSVAFFTDFDQADQFPDLQVNGAMHSPWYHYAFLTNLGVQASVEQGNPGGLAWPSAYTQDTGSTAAGAGRPGVLKLNLYDVAGSWKVGNIATVNNNGVGRRFFSGIHEVRFRYQPTDTDPLPGTFPAPIWGYTYPYLFWRAQSRNEMDHSEQTGASQAYMEGSIHLHGPQYATADPNVNQVDNSIKYYGYQQSTVNGFTPAVNFWDSSWHLFQRLQDPDANICITYLDGKEVARSQYHASMDDPMFFIINNAKDYPGHGPEDLVSGTVYSLEIDYVRVLYKDTRFAAIPTGFSARPTIAGTTTSGSLLTVTPNTTASHIEYRWYRSDGTPIVLATGNTYTLTASEVGFGVWCAVTAKSYKGQPEAYSTITSTIS